MNAPVRSILIVEDEPADVEFLSRAFRKAGGSAPVLAVCNGEEAIAYLQGDGRFADRTRFPFPRLIMTDLKMPQMDGIQLLQWINRHPQFRLIPRLVLSSSTAQNDVDAAYAAGAHAYLVKPVEIRELEQIAHTIAAYSRLSLLPTVP